ncbi:MAG: hypothetical protein HUK14_06875 [Muribaculaceae bacterium]|nr:hypothetical protein [Muribaculaceae bacterium]
MNKFTQKLILCGALLLAAMPAAAEDGVLAFSYDDGSAPSSMWGTMKKENYDVAVFFNNPRFVGCEIVGLRVMVQNSDYVNNYSAWLSSELALDGKVNAPNIASKAGERQDSQLEIMFDTPYKLTSDGVYVGYSFNVVAAGDDAGCYPVAVMEGVNTKALFLHTSRTFTNWSDQSAAKGVLSSLEILLKGEFTQNSVAVVSMDEINALLGSNAPAIITVANTGANTIANIGYEFTVNGETQSDVYTFSTPLPAQYGATAALSLDMPKLSQVGTYPIRFTVTDVNGKPNTETSGTSAETNYCVISKIPKHVAVVEEFTGTWCQWCPRGYVGMELMNKKHADFIGIAYHSNDPMEISGTAPFIAQGYPSASIERALVCDPYNGLSDDNSEFGIDPLWQEYCKPFTPFDISLKADFTDDSQSAVKVDASVVSVKALSDGEYRIEYVLLEDNMNGTDGKWRQVNAYSGREASRGMEGMDMFIDAPSPVLVPFNDVAVANTGNLGIEGSLPATLEPDVEYTHSHTFDLASLKNASGADIILDKTKLRVAVLVVLNDGSTYGRIMNAQKGLLDSLSSCAPLEVDDATDAPAEYFDLNGRKVAAPAASGLYIRRTATKAQKVLIK